MCFPLISATSGTLGRKAFGESLHPFEEEHHNEEEHDGNIDRHKGAENEEGLAEGYSDHCLKRCGLTMNLRACVGEEVKSAGLDEE